MRLLSLSLLRSALLSYISTREFLRTQEKGREKHLSSVLKIPKCLYNSTMHEDKGFFFIISFNQNYNKILESDWFLARPIFYQISNNKVSNNKVSNNKVRVLRMRALYIWFLVVTKYSLIFLKPSASRMAFLPY